MMTTFAYLIAVAGWKLQRSAKEEMLKARTRDDRRHFRAIVMICRAALVLSLGYVVFLVAYHMANGTFYIRLFVPAIPFALGICSLVGMVQWNTRLVAHSKEPDLKDKIGQEELARMKRLRGVYILVGLLVGVVASVIALMVLLALLLLSSPVPDSRVW